MLAYLWILWAIYIYTYVCIMYYIAMFHSYMHSLHLFLWYKVGQSWGEVPSTFTSWSCRSPSIYLIVRSSFWTLLICVGSMPMFAACNPYFPLEKNTPEALHDAQGEWPRTTFRCTIPDGLRDTASQMLICNFRQRFNGGCPSEQWESHKGWRKYQWR